MASQYYYAKVALQRSIEENDLQQFKRYCDNYMLNTNLDIVILMQPGFSFFTPLIYASRLGSIDIIDYLLSNPNILALDTIDNYGQNALMNSVHSRSLGIFRQLCMYSSPHSEDNEKNSCIHIAASIGALEILRVCIEEIGLKDTKNIYGQGALHLAESAEVIEYLIVQDFDVNSQDENGWSALHYAVYKGLVDCVRVLIQIGINLQLVDRDGKRALEFAKEYAVDLVEILQEEIDKSVKIDEEVESEDSSEERKIMSPEVEMEKSLKEKKFILSPEVHDQIIEVDSEGDDFPIEPLVKTPLIMSERLKRNSSSDSINKSQITPKIHNMLSEYLLKTPSDFMSLSDFGVEMIKYNELKFREVLGKGAYGTVHRGYFRESEVAIKVINTEKIDDRLAKEFIKEIESLVKIRHNRFLLLLGVCIEGPLCIVTELSKGGNLASAIEKHSLLVDQKLKIALQIAEGIHYIHSKNPPIVHRDLKPQNILLDEYNQVKIADLGLSRAIEKVSNTEKINSTRVCAGTIRYMAPELYYEEPVCLRATDIWAYGCVIYHLFTGNLPWTGLEQVAVQRRLILREPFICNAEMTFGIEEIVKGCCQVDPEKRIGFKEIKVKILELLGVQNSQHTD